MSKISRGDSSSGTKFTLRSLRSCWRHLEPLWNRSFSWCESAGSTTRSEEVLCDRRRERDWWSVVRCAMSMSGGGDGGRAILTILWVELLCLINMDVCLGVSSRQPECFKTNWVANWTRISSNDSGFSRIIYSIENGPSERMTSRARVLPDSDWPCSTCSKSK